MKLKYKSNQLIEVGNSPLGEDIIFSPKPPLVFEPFESECRKKNFLSCSFLAEMYSLNKNAEKALELWEVACKGGLESACKKTR